MGNILQTLWLEQIAEKVVVEMVEAAKCPHLFEKPSFGDWRQALQLDRPIHAVLATIVTSFNPTTIPCICIEIELNFSHHVGGWVRMAV